MQHFSLILQTTFLYLHGILNSLLNSVNGTERDIFLKNFNWRTLQKAYYSSATRTLMMETVTSSGNTNQYDVTSQKALLFINTALRIWSLSWACLMKMTDSTPDKSSITFPRLLMIQLNAYRRIRISDR